MDVSSAPVPYWFRPRCPVADNLPVLREETFRSQDNTVSITLQVTAAALSYKMESNKYEGVTRSIPLDFVLAATVLPKEAASLEVSHYPIDKGSTRTRSDKSVFSALRCLNRPVA
jgi:hypothetical protein